MREIRGLVGAVAASLALLGGSGAAGAATLKASYQLQDSRTSQFGSAPALADIGAGNQFATERVDGTERRVLAFPEGGGVSLQTAGLVDRGSHSIVMTFRLADTSGYRRLLDFSDGSSDDGLYVLGGRPVLYVGGDLAIGPEPIREDAFVQVALTSRVTASGAQRTAVYVNGAPVAAGTTTHGFELGSGGLRFFADNLSGGAGGEESAGALACLLVYDGAMTADEVERGALDPLLCPAPKTVPLPPLPFKSGVYAGTTSQGLSIAFAVQRTLLGYLTFRWRAKCADGRVHTNGIALGGTRIRHGRFSVFGVLETGGRARVSGRLKGGRAKGRLSRWGNSAFDTDCPARGIRWHAHLTDDEPPPF